MDSLYLLPRSRVIENTRMGSRMGVYYNRVSLTNNLKRYSNGYCWVHETLSGLHRFGDELACDCAAECVLKDCAEAEYITEMLSMMRRTGFTIVEFDSSQCIAVITKDDMYLFSNLAHCKRHVDLCGCTRGVNMEDISLQCEECNVIDKGLYRMTRLHERLLEALSDVIENGDEGRYGLALLEHVTALEDPLKSLDNIHESVNSLGILEGFISPGISSNCVDIEKVIRECNVYAHKLVDRALGELDSICSSLINQVNVYCQSPVNIYIRWLKHSFCFEYLAEYTVDFSSCYFDEFSGKYVPDLKNENTILHEFIQPSILSIKSVENTFKLVLERLKTYLTIKRPPPSGVKNDLESSEVTTQVGSDKLDDVVPYWWNFYYNPNTLGEGELYSSSAASNLFDNIKRFTRSQHKDESCTPKNTKRSQTELLTRCISSKDLTSKNTIYTCKSEDTLCLCSKCISHFSNVSRIHSDVNYKVNAANVCTNNMDMKKITENMRIKHTSTGYYKSVSTTPSLHVGNNVLESSHSSDNSVLTTSTSSSGISFYSNDEPGTPPKDILKDPHNFNMVPTTHVSPVTPTTTTTPRFETDSERNKTTDFDSHCDCTSSSYLTPAEKDGSQGSARDDPISEVKSQESAGMTDGSKEEPSPKGNNVLSGGMSPQPSFEEIIMGDMLVMRDVNDVDMLLLLRNSMRLALDMSITLKYANPKDERIKKMITSLNIAMLSTYRLAEYVLNPTESCEHIRDAELYDALEDNNLMDDVVIDESLGPAPAKSTFENDQYVCEDITSDVDDGYSYSSISSQSPKLGLNIKRKRLTDSPISRSKINKSNSIDKSYRGSSSSLENITIQSRRSTRELYHSDINDDMYIYDINDRNDFGDYNMSDDWFIEDSDTSSRRSQKYHQKRLPASKPSVSSLTDIYGSQDALIPMGPLPIGVYFDASRKLWRCQWRENGKFRTKGFSLGHYNSLLDARHACIEFRCQVGNIAIQPEWLSPNYVKVSELVNKRAPTTTHSTPKKSNRKKNIH